MCLWGHWGGGEEDVHLLAAEGILIEAPATAFLVEVIAAESAMSFIREIAY